MILFIFPNLKPCYAFPNRGLRCRFYFHSQQFVPRIQETAALLRKRLCGHARLIGQSDWRLVGPLGELYTEKSKRKFQESLKIFNFTSQI